MSTGPHLSQKAPRGHKKRNGYCAKKVMENQEVVAVVAVALRCRFRARIGEVGIGKTWGGSVGGGALVAVCRFFSSGSRCFMLLQVWEKQSNVEVPI